MPRGDRTGPMGLGPMTGRRAGYCAGYPVPGYANPWVPPFGLGWRLGGRGAWGGWRWRHWYYATGLPGWARFGYAPAWGVPPVVPYAGPLSQEQELEFLRAQAEGLKEQLDAISKRIAELEKSEKEE